MDEEYKIIDSPLSRTITREGVSIEVHIYRGEHDPGWILEVVDETAASTVWDEMFKTETDALNEVMRTIELESIHSFSENPNKTPH